MDYNQIAIAIEAFLNTENTRIIQYGFTGLFLLYAMDRVVGLIAMRKARQKIASWSESQGQFLGATDEIKIISKKIGLLAITLVITKPVLMIAAMYFGQKAIDPIGVLILGSAILFYYYTGVSKFLKRTRAGQATNVPIQMKQAWLQLDLNRAGLTLFQIRYALAAIVTHSLYEAFKIVV